MSSTTGPLACLVPVLPTAGLSFDAVRLHGAPLFVHACRSLAAAVEGPVIVAVPVGAEPSVAAELAANGVVGPDVLSLGASLGEVLARALQLPGAWSDPTVSVVLHDPRCPLTPPAALAEAVTTARARPGAVVVAARAMTDTVKELVDGVVRATVDRERLRVLASPLVLPGERLRRVAEVGALAGCADVDALLQVVRTAGAPLVWVPAPVAARRVSDSSEVAVLECLTGA